MTDAPVAYDVSDQVATIALARPDAMNSLTLAAKEALKRAVLDAASDERVRCVVLTGSGRAFCVGQDLREHAAALESQAVDELWSTVPEHYAPIALGLATMPKPVIAAVNGVAAGAGVSLALACDFRIAADNAGFNTAFAGIGLSCDTGISWTLPRLIGRAKALELLLTPRTVRAPEAAELGLVTRVVPGDELTAATTELARQLAAGPTQAYAAIKRAVTYSATHDLAAALDHEGTQMAHTGATHDHRDAVGAFLAKQTPTYHGR
ncbi:MAG TPA: enoyl-CoA hydratase-related protein [Nocardioidaceae bacterium]|nr:enoyl-CoA hydratase-related protein [Nocardioidaceae bacterium]